MARLPSALCHLAAALAALAFAWQVSQTALVTTSVQFVAPLLLIIAVHTLWLALGGGLRPGFALRVLGRSAGTAAGMVAVFALASLVAPMPAAADEGEVVFVLSILACLVVLLMVVAVAGFVIYFVFRLMRGLVRMLGKGPEDGPGSRLHDFASLGAAVAVLGALSLEGLPELYAFQDDNEVVASRVIEAEAAQVWATMETATSPEFPLPAVLDIFPRPVAVTVDEGTGLGANRQVRFTGREGSGVLSLRVVERTPELARFEVLDDTSPYAGWMRFEGLRYRVTPMGDATRLEVALRFERKLAPHWFFTPAMRGAGALAMDVLARDVKRRAEF
ncbi:MAG: SRPBCC family protein [Vannielia sp.]|uniref:SRPBCC family protein n=1 Tax=Vannielia sp. TaxID=2813045 RepID=UPI003B8CD15A